MRAKPIKKTAITIYFSKDRPMQLALALETNSKQSVDYTSQVEAVLYTTSNEDYEKAYEDLKLSYPQVRFVKEKSFKKDLLSIIKDREFVMFVVDDTVFTHKYSLDTICSYLNEENGILGFSLRLGKNTKHCYPINRKNDMPYMEEYSDGTCVFNWAHAGIGDFSYPLEVSSSVYKVNEIKDILEGCKYDSPNSLEWAMYSNVPTKVNTPYLMCYATSVAFSNPINKVQKENENKFSEKDDYNPLALLEMYNSGYMVDADFYDGFVSTGCHQEVGLLYL